MYITLCRTMTQCDFRAVDGTTRALDLDLVIDVVAGASGRKPGWSALVVLEPSTLVFVELRDAPEDFRGNCESEAEEVDEAYLANVFGLSAANLSGLRANPRGWKFIDRRPGARAA